MRLAVLAVIAIAGFAPAAFADAPVATGGDSGASPPQPSAAPPPLRAEPTGIDSSGRPLAIGPCGPTTVKPDGHLDTSAHGEIEAGVGTNGYRHVAASVCKPLGDAGAIAVSVGGGQYGDAPRRR
jgi:hypothetical protein